jgi:hypothetical protein
MDRCGRRLGFVRAEAARYYAADVGRPSIDPIVTSPIS